MYTLSTWQYKNIDKITNINDFKYKDLKLDIWRRRRKLFFSFTGSIVEGLFVQSHVTIEI
jgi:hypothetical protein